MFLIGTAMVVFGMGLHFMFVASKGKGSQLPGSNLFGLFNLEVRTVGFFQVWSPKYGG